MTMFCTNNNDFYHEDRYDGQTYRFPPGEKVAVSEEAAMHMFGWRQVDKNPALHRLGWAMRFDRDEGWTPDEAGLKKLMKFVFSEAVLVEKVIEPGQELVA